MAEAVRDHETARLEKVLDRPTPFTRKAYAMRRSTKRRLEARVFIKAIQARYLEAQEGRRHPHPQAPCAGCSRRNPKKQIWQHRAPARSSATLQSPPCSLERPGVEARGRASISARASAWSSWCHMPGAPAYSPRLGFKRSASRFTSQRFPVIWEKALRCAFASRRR